MVESVNVGEIYQALDPDTGRFYGRSRNPELTERHIAAINARRERIEATLARNAEVRERAMGRIRR
jgi:hypothetical protein